MKRSEMIQKGVDRLNKISTNPVPQHSFKGEEFHFLANTLLDVFEKAGMLPTKSLDTTCIKKGLVRGYTMMFEWDDENES